MDNVQRITELFTNLIKMMVDTPDDVHVDPVVGEASVMLNLRVAQSDAG